jgi:hypothetical protein
LVKLNYYYLHLFDHPHLILHRLLLHQFDLHDKFLMIVIVVMLNL